MQASVHEGLLVGLMNTPQKRYCSNEYITTTTTAITIITTITISESLQVLKGREAVVGGEAVRVMILIFSAALTAKQSQGIDEYIVVPVPQLLFVGEVLFVSRGSMSR